MKLKSERPLHVFVVIPTLNEEKSVGWVVQGCHEVLKDMEHEVIVVDGYSSDGTAEVAKKAGATVIYEKGKGYGAALMTGFHYVLENYPNGSNVESIIAMMDGDATYTPEDIPRIIQPIISDGADIVIGNRFGGMRIGAMTLLNRIGNRFLTALLNRLYGLKIVDSQSGMRAMRTKALRQMYLEATGMPLASEMLIEARKRGMQIAEVPISYGKRVGIPKLDPLRDGWRIVLTSFRLLTDFSPFLVFGALSVFFFILSAYFGIEALYGWFMWKYYHLPTWPRLGSALLGATFFTTGFVLFAFGLLLDAVLRVLKQLRRLVEEIRETSTKL
ncbi:glycosyltransferase [Candidatus Bathyarchaeota archaeon]|nr:glycosyltransferase [Candidatus Bathyarchaeota archaeon]